MRAPRYRFPDEVRSTARGMASLMVREGAVPRTPEELEVWISGRPEFRQPLVRGGYETAFTAHDLFPLVQVFVAKAGGPAPEPDPPPRTSNLRWPVAGTMMLVLVIAIVVLLLACASHVRP
jgi:hypothetical protein